MKKFLFLLLLCGSLRHANANAVLYPAQLAQHDTIPSAILGDFIDDYDIRYTITDSVWLQHSNMKYHIIKWDTTAQYIIAQNDKNNPTEAGKYTRIDYTFFTGMAPWKWGFCLTVYNAQTPELAENGAVADRKNPRKGCNGFPFSRMKRKE